MVSETEVIEAISKLGTTTTEIRNFLVVRGIKGYRNNPEACPLAVYLRRTFPGESLINVGGNSTIVVNGVELPLDSLLTCFISNIDQGIYPELCFDARDDDDEDEPYNANSL